MTGRTALRPGLAAVVAEEFGPEGLALDLFGEFLGARGTRRAPVRSLVAAAGARGTATSWPLRRAAALMLEARLFEAPAGDLAAFEAVLRAIADDPSSGLTYPPGPSVLAEGYTADDPEGFAAQLRDRIARNARVFARLDGPETTAEVLRGFLRLARDESRLTLARYLFTPGEVARRVLGEVRASRGMPAPFREPFVGDEAQAILSEWPPYERAVVEELAAGSRVLWADEATGRRINALVEYPLGTVVLVVKPPGSHREVEFKRAGRPGDRPLSVVFERDGGAVPPTHRLDGGSMSASLRSEALGAALFGRAFRLVHGRRAPISVTLAHRVVRDVPRDRGRDDLLDYFTRPDAFGDEFDAVRDAMRRTVDAFSRQWGSDPLDAPGELGETVAFLGVVNPVQALIAETSSFRLDLIESYLSAEGPGRYFRDGLGAEPTAADLRWFAETLLDEALGGFEPVEAGRAGHAALIEAVLAEPANRRKADATFLGLARQAGEVWGTLFGIKGYSMGESFVGRNVGLRSAWEGGAWRVRLVFMDHDMLSIPRERYVPDLALWGSYVDIRYILFDPPSGRRSEIDLLASIYRVDGPTEARGRSAFWESARSAYRRTRSALATDPGLGAIFEESYRADLLDWEDATGAFVNGRLAGRDRAEALRDGSELLRARGHSEEAVDSFAELTGRYAEFLLCLSALYEPGPEASDPTPGAAP